MIKGVQKMEKNMFCFQCEQTAGCNGCTGSRGVCGKTEDEAKAQEELHDDNATPRLLSVGVTLLSVGCEQMFPNKQSYRMVIADLLHNESSPMCW